MLQFSSRTQAFLNFSITAPTSLYHPTLNIIMWESQLVSAIFHFGIHTNGENVLNRLIFVLFYWNLVRFVGKI